METDSENKIPLFLKKLFNLVEDQSTDSLIRWSEDGNSFIIINQKQFTDILPCMFKHNNFTSFIRQLNMYGFTKIQNIDSGALRLDRDECRYANTFFNRGRFDRLHLIKRKKNNNELRARDQNQNNESSAIADERINELMLQVDSLQKKQETVNSEISFLKSANKRVYERNADMLKKINSQQDIISKLMHFLVSLVKPRQRNINSSLQNILINSTGSNLPALTDGQDLIHAQQLMDAGQELIHGQNVNRGQAVNMPPTSTVPSDSRGPVIHEVTDELSSISPNQSDISPVQITEADYETTLPQKFQPMTSNSTEKFPQYLSDKVQDLPSEVISGRGDTVASNLLYPTNDKIESVITGMEESCGAPEKVSASIISDSDDYSDIHLNNDQTTHDFSDFLSERKNSGVFNSPSVFEVNNRLKIIEQDSSSLNTPLVQLNSPVKFVNNQPMDFSTHGSRMMVDSKDDIDKTINISRSTSKINSNNRNIISIPNSGAIRLVNSDGKLLNNSNNINSAVRLKRVNSKNKVIGNGSSTYLNLARNPDNNVISVNTPNKPNFPIKTISRMPTTKPTINSYKSTAPSKLQSRKHKDLRLNVTKGNPSAEKRRRRESGERPSKMPVFKVVPSGGRDATDKDTSNAVDLLSEILRESGTNLANESQEDLAFDTSLALPSTTTDVALARSNGAITPESIGRKLEELRDSMGGAYDGIHVDPSLQNQVKQFLRADLSDFEKMFSGNVMEDKRNGEENHQQLALYNSSPRNFSDIDLASFTGSTPDYRGNEQVFQMADVDHSMLFSSIDPDRHHISVPGNSEQELDEALSQVIPKD